MLPIQFFGQNAHFAINLFAALVFFAVFWLSFDAWLLKREFKEFIKWASFLLIAVSYVASATVIEQAVAGRSSFGSITDTVAQIMLLIGFIGVIAGQLLDPLQKVPELKGLEAEEFTKDGSEVGAETSASAARSATLKSVKQPKKAKKVQGIGFFGTAGMWQVGLPLGALAITVLYYRRATTGLERHYKPVAIAFGLLFVTELLSLAHIWRDSSNPVLSRAVASFGPIWIAEQIFLLAAMVVLGKWVWGYLMRRFVSQLFMIFTSLTLVIFLVTTVSFTYLLVKNVEKASLDNLQTAVNVLNYAIEGKKSETLANTQSVAENPEIVSSVAASNHAALIRLTESYLQEKKLTSLVITGDAGQVLLRAEDPNRYGDSVSSDTMIRRALTGQSNSSVTTREGVISPLVYIRSAVPIRDSSGRIVGAAVAGLVTNNAFVDGIKRDTGLDSAVYAGDVRSATTFVAADGVSRWVGVEETNQTVKDTVLKAGKPYQGTVRIQNRYFLSAYAPLKDVDNTVVGMLFIGQPQVRVLDAASRSIELTFIITALLLMLTIIPAYLISKYIAYQLE